MKIYEIQLEDPTGALLYKSLVPEIHVHEKIDKLVGMNKIENIGAIKILPMGDISDRYIQSYLHPKNRGKID
jgi:hypothetical protein